MITIKQINKMLERKGVEERLYRGKDYFYFYGGTTDCWPDTMVYTTRLNDNTIEGWWANYKYLRLAAADAEG
jgi:hypothetical protein